ncbi:MAG: hypothetical protein AB1432_16415, partial [Bacteroidota bacterium]
AETTINVAAKSSGAGIGSCGYQPQLYKKTSFTKVIFHLNLYTFLVYINYQGVGIVACYYTRRDTSPTKLKVVFGLAKDLLDGTNGWNANTIKEIYSYTLSGKVGYQSFFHPLSQYKGIGVSFESNGNAYPVIEFMNISGMTNVLTILGL